MQVKFLPLSMHTAYLFLLASVAMSLGWRIRGQFGHEVGAAMAGALVGLAIVIAAGRKDWHHRALYFAGLGGIGWAFGGSMSYMKVVGYCHSSDPTTVLYGFTCLLLVGFLWAAPGGAAIALAAILDVKRLDSIIFATASVFAAWFVQDIVVDLLDGRRVNTEWYGSDWIAASSAMVGVLIMALFRRNIDFGVLLVLHLSLGWWIGFAGLVLVGGLHMNPPRGDNWAGCLGLVLGMIVFLCRNRCYSIVRASLLAGFVGAVGFVFAQMVKLAILRAEWIQDPHPIMEWMHGAFFGIATVVAIQTIRNSAPVLSRDTASRLTTTLLMFWLLWIIPYYNFRKCADQWVKQMPSLEEVVQGLPMKGSLIASTNWIGWVEVVFLAWAIVLLISILRNRKEVSLFLPNEPYGRGVLLFIVLVGFFSFSSFSRDLTNFDTGRELPIQVAITLHTLACILLVLWNSRNLKEVTDQGLPEISLKRTLFYGLVGGLLTVAFCSIGKEFMFRKEFAGGFYMDHIRFGPHNTNDKK